MRHRESVKVTDLYDHGDAVASAAIETIANWYFDEWDSKDPEATIEQVVEKVASTFQRCAFVAYFNGDLVGAAEINFQKNSDYPSYSHWIDGVYVPASQRGKGISTALINYAKVKIKELGVSALYLRCEDHLVELYQSHGFRVIQRENSKYIMVFEDSDLEPI